MQLIALTEALDNVGLGLGLGLEVPVAFCIADKEDADVIGEFMVAIAEVGDVQAIGGMHAHAQNKLAPLTAS